MAKEHNGPERQRCSNTSCSFFKLMVKVTITLGMDFNFHPCGVRQGGTVSNCVPVTASSMSDYNCQDPNKTSCSPHPWDIPTGVRQTKGTVERPVEPLQAELVDHILSQFTYFIIWLNVNHSDLINLSICFSF